MTTACPDQVAAAAGNDSAGARYQQVSHQPDVQEAGRSLHRCRLLLQDEAGSDQQRRKQGGDVEAEADVHKFLR